MNTYLNPLLDKSGGKSEEVSKYATDIIALLEEFNLVDIWRVVNPDTKRYTWRGVTRNGIVQSRLGYWFIYTTITIYKQLI